MVRKEGKTYALPVKSIVSRLRLDTSLVTQDADGNFFYSNIPVYSITGSPEKGKVDGEYLLVLYYLGKRGCIPVDDLLFEDDIPSEKMTSTWRIIHMSTGYQ